MSDLCSIHDEFHLFFVYLAIHDRTYIFQFLFQRKQYHVWFDFPSTQSTHIQHIIDQRKQMSRRQVDLSQTILNICRIFRIHTNQFHHSQNAIQRCPDIMGHMGQEFRFRTVRTLLLLFGSFQLLLIVHHGFDICRFSVYINPEKNRKDHQYCSTHKQYQIKCPILSYYCPEGTILRIICNPFRFQVVEHTLFGQFLDCLV